MSVCEAAARSEERSKGKDGADSGGSVASGKTRRSSMQESLDEGRRPRKQQFKKAEEWIEFLDISVLLEGCKGHCLGKEK